MYFPASEMALFLHCFGTKAFAEMRNIANVDVTWYTTAHCGTLSFGCTPQQTK